MSLFHIDIEYQPGSAVVRLHRRQNGDVDIIKTSNPNASPTPASEEGAGLSKILNEGLSGGPIDTVIATIPKAKFESVIKFLTP